MSFVDRVRSLAYKPTVPGDQTNVDWDAPTSKEELEVAVRSADDKERLIGLIAAPLAAIIAFTTSAALIANDPPKLLSSGALNPKHYSETPYQELQIVLLVMSVLILGFAWYRKRAPLAIALALYGLGVFNLHYWGFGLPFILAGAWLLVRHYRLGSDLKEAGGGIVHPSAATPPDGAARPRPNKRYTPPSSSTRRWSSKS